MRSALGATAALSCGPDAAARLLAARQRLRRALECGVPPEELQALRMRLAAIDRALAVLPTLARTGGRDAQVCPSRMKGAEDV